VLRRCSSFRSGPVGLLALVLVAAGGIPLAGPAGGRAVAATRTVTLEHVAFGNVADLGKDGTPDSVGEPPFDNVSVMSSPEGTANFRDERGMLEYDCAEINPARIVAARIEGTVFVINSLDTGVRHIDVAAYRGDGAVTLDDYNADATMVGTILFPAIEPMDFTFDVTDALAADLAAGGEYFGVRFEPVNEQAASAVGRTPPHNMLLIVELTRVPGDANGDGRVDLYDFVILKQNFGADDPTYDEGDFDEDGDVDLDDFSILKVNFGACG